VETKGIVGKLYIIATPIGNLDDITLRAINTLKKVDFIACEDTRRTGVLLKKYDITKRLISFYSYNKIKRLDNLISLLKEGRLIGLVSDSGTPGISDPGYALIKAAIDNNIPVESIPGPVALINALVVSGKPTNKFVFEGFLSNKSQARRRRLTELKNEKRTIIIYESPHRILRLLNDIFDIFGNTQLVCARELTKIFEEIKRGRASELIEYFTKNRPRGEFIVII